MLRASADRQQPSARVGRAPSRACRYLICTNKAEVLATVGCQSRSDYRCMKCVGVQCCFAVLLVTVHIRFLHILPSNGIKRGFYQVGSLTPAYTASLWARCELGLRWCPDRRCYWLCFARLVKMQGSVWGPVGPMKRGLLCHGQPVSASEVRPL